ncbi:nematocyst expressed protein 4-like [Cloeon dipterum]|uniref:nematocyst expressed protein 4-like n=1 Tax=Cloeon dipterum TaxID=197152 RepID=UPI0032209CD2
MRWQFRVAVILGLLALTLAGPLKKRVRHARSSEKTFFPDYFLPPPVPVPVPGPPVAVPVPVPVPVPGPPVPVPVPPHFPYPPPPFPYPPPPFPYPPPFYYDEADGKPAEKDFNTEIKED